MKYIEIESANSLTAPSPPFLERTKSETFFAESCASAGTIPHPAFFKHSISFSSLPIYITQKEIYFFPHTIVRSIYIYCLLVDDSILNLVFHIYEEQQD